MGAPEPLSCRSGYLKTGTDQMTSRQFTFNRGASTIEITANSIIIAFTIWAVSPFACVAEVGATRLVSGFVQPTYVTVAPGDDSRLFVIEKAGSIRIFDRSRGKILSEPFLSIPQFTVSEAGMVGLAFAPDFWRSGVFYVTHTPASSPMPTLTRFHVSAGDTNRADPTSAEMILSIEGTPALHMGGWIGFHPDNGLLYLTVGDGDGLYPGLDYPHEGHAQNLKTLRGKILRLQVEATGPYTIPADNPFIAGGGRPEIWSYGVRNPWRGSFDRLTHDYFFGDVGNNAREEIDMEPAGSSGGRNYGWSTYEGTLDTGFNLPGNPTPGDPSLIPPLFDYIHGSNWGSAVVGGYVYRGSDLPELTGQYLFGDYTSGRLWCMKDRGTPSQTITEIRPLFSDRSRRFHHISSFGEDNIGRVFVLEFNDGDLFQLTPPPSAVSLQLGPFSITQDGRFHVQTPQSESGLTLLQVSSDLKAWVDVPGYTTGSGEEFSDNITREGARFYRLR